MAFNKKVAIISLCSILLVALVIGVVVTHVQNKNNDAENEQRARITESRKAVQSICKPTQYRQTCEKTLMPVAKNNTDPKELIKAGFDYAEKHIRHSLNKSALLQEAEKDPRTNGAYKVCEKVLDLAIDDLKRSFNKINDFDIDHLDDHLFDLKVWLSAANTAQGTCLDAFEKTSGDAGEKMKKLLKISRELTINGFNMIDELSRVLANMEGTGSHNRKLLQIPAAGNFPSWVKDKKKELFKGDTAKQMADVIVAQDGSGKFTTISEAIRAIPKDNMNPFIIYIKAGVYREYVRIEKFMPNLVLVGDGPTKTKITGDRSEKKGFSTLDSATVGVLGFNFIAKDIGFENTAAADEGPAVAIHIAADKSIFHNCRFDGNQDTLFSHDYRQFFRDCTVSGTIDFIFGDSIVVLQNCTIVARPPAVGQANMIAAQGREFPDDITGIVIQNCTITADPAVLANPKIQTYLGRPWKTFSRMVVIDSYIESFINPLGWQIWEEKNPNNMTAYIVEFENKGPGADVTRRVKWPSIKKLTSVEAANFTPSIFLKGDEWISPSGVPYNSQVMGTSFNNTSNSNMTAATAPAPTSVPATAPASAPVTAPASAPVTAPDTMSRTITF